MRHTAWFLLAMLFTGCSRAEGKGVSDLLQYMLQQAGWFAWLVCLVLVFLFFNLLRIGW